jgi:phosphoribosylformylglycinamidine synthase
MPTTTEHPNTRIWAVQVRPRSPEIDSLGRNLLADLRQLPSLAHIDQVRTSRLYFLEGTLDPDHADRVATRLLTDPVAESCTLSDEMATRDPTEVAIEVHCQPGVMDPVALSTREAIADLLRDEPDQSVHQVRTARRYTIRGAAGEADLQRIADHFLANDCIETVYIQGFGRNDRLPASFPAAPVASVARRTVAIRNLDGPQLATLSREAHLFLSIEELEAVRAYFVAAGRDPTDLELETLAQTWSEHCVHKTLKSDVEYRGDDFGRPGQVEIRFDNLLKSTIVHATYHLARPWCLSVFDDNAGVIAFDDDYGIAFKVETHNHPSAIEPYGVG